MKPKPKVIVLLSVMAFMMASMTVGADKGAKTAVVRSAGDMAFKEVIPGVSKTVLWGNPEKGAYGTLTKFAKGTKNALHTHTHDIKIVVVSGTLIEDFGDGEKSLGPGSYVFEPAGMKHANRAGDDSDCLFFEESNGAFDVQWVK